MARSYADRDESGTRTLPRTLFCLGHKRILLILFPFVPHECSFWILCVPETRDNPTHQGGGPFHDKPQSTREVRLLSFPYELYRMESPKELSPSLFFSLIQTIPTRSATLSVCGMAGFAAARLGPHRSIETIQRMT